MDPTRGVWISDCGKSGSSGNPACCTINNAAASETVSRLAVDPLAGTVVSVTHNAEYSILPLSFALTATVGCAQTPT